MQAPILQALQMGQPQPQQNPLLSQDKFNKLISMYRGITNPQAYLQELIQNNNPMIREVMQEIQNNGGNAQAAFYNYAKQHGLDPNEILNMMNGRR